jgi:hypothetical protein
LDPGKRTIVSEESDAIVAWLTTLESQIRDMVPFLDAIQYDAWVDSLSVELGEMTKASLVDAFAAKLDADVPDPVEISPEEP